MLEGDDENKFLNLIREGLELVKHDSLGGHGSRGYGSVDFEIEEINRRTMDDYRNGVTGKSITNHPLSSLFKNSIAMTA